jgi:hypothetical protein
MALAAHQQQQQPASFFTTTPPSSIRRPSFSSRAWLSGHRSNSSTSSVNQPTVPTPLRISEPQLTGSLDFFVSQPKFKASSRMLGMGAEIVKTPEEAIAAMVEDVFAEENELLISTRHSSEDDRPLPPIPPASPTSPTSPTLRASRSTPHLLSSPRSMSPPSSPPRPNRANNNSPRAVPASVLRSALKVSSPPLNTVPLPPLPSAAPVPSQASPSEMEAVPQAPFRPILISPAPSSVNDPSQVMITLETSQATARTTLHTLTSVPSFLSTYLTTLVPTTVTAPPSPTSPFSELYKSHQEAVGVASSPPSNNQPMHIFLDRPSAPYTHILTFLRSSVPVLPRQVQLQPNTTARFEALMELRDEARYLGMEGLERLCEEELRRRPAASASGHHVRGQSSGLKSSRSRMDIMSGMDVDSQETSPLSALRSRVSDPPTESLGLLRSRGRSTSPNHKLNPPLPVSSSKPGWI